MPLCVMVLLGFNTWTVFPPWPWLAAFWSHTDSFFPKLLLRLQSCPLGVGSIELNGTAFGMDILRIGLSDNAPLSKHLIKPVMPVFQIWASSLVVGRNVWDESCLVNGNVALLRQGGNWANQSQKFAPALLFHHHNQTYLWVIIKIVYRPLIRPTCRRPVSESIAHNFSIHKFSFIITSIFKQQLPIA